MRSLSIVAFVGACLAASVWLLVISGGVYGLGWWYFRPLFVVRTPIDFDFSGTPKRTPASDLISFPELALENQNYALNLELQLPRSPHNLRLSNFMVTLELYGHKSEEPVQTLKRMNMVPYKSSLLETMDEILFLPLYLFGWSNQVEKLEVDLRQLAMPLRNYKGIKLKLSDNVQVAAAELVWTTQLKGVRRLMYNSPLSSCFVCVGALWFTGVLVTITVALLVNLRIGEETPERRMIERAPRALPERRETTPERERTPPTSTTSKRVRTPRTTPARTTRTPTRRFLRPRRFRVRDVTTSDWSLSDVDESVEDTENTTVEEKM